jgi:hypothetical protein
MLQWRRLRRNRPDKVRLPIVPAAQRLSTCGDIGSISHSLESSLGNPSREGALPAYPQDVCNADIGFTYVTPTGAVFPKRVDETGPERGLNWISTRPG